MRHPAEGTLRRLLDEPFAVALRDRTHIASCARCQARLAAVESDARTAAAVMAVPTLDPDVSAALAAARQRSPLPARGAPAGSGVLADMVERLRPPWTPALRAAAALAAAVVLVGALAVTGAGTSLANALLTIFQPQQVATISITPADFSALPDLSAYGTITWTAEPSEHVVGSLAAAQAEVGSPVLAPNSVPAGVTDTATYYVFPASSGFFTFDPNRAAAAAGVAGATIPPMPADVAGTTLYASVGPGLLQVFHTTGSLSAADASAAPGLSSLPALVIGQTKAPTVSTTGATFAELQDYLLAQPGISPSLAAQLRSLGDPSQTLPIPVPAGATVTSKVTVRGVSGVWIGLRGGLGGGVIWQSGDIIYGVGGLFDQQQLLDIANNLN
jgi:hypothetical protein